MKKIAIFIFSIMFIFTANAETPITTSITSTGTDTSIMVGNDKDEHGCIGSAGYSWDETQKMCIKSWNKINTNTGTDTSIMVGNDKDEHGCIGSAGYSWDETQKMCVRPWEEEPRMCTMEYAPMCGVDGVTYGNKCMAGKKEIAYAGECDAYINTAKLAKYKKTTAKYDKKLAKVKTEKLEKGIEKVNKMIETIKLTKMTKEAIIKKVTEYTFIKYLFENELSKR